MSQDRPGMGNPAPQMEVDLTAFRRAHAAECVQDLRFTLPAGPTGLGPQMQLVEPTVVSVHLAGDGDVVAVDVAADLRLGCPCDRCLEAVELALPVAFTEEWHLVRGERHGRDGQSGPGSVGTDLADGEMDDEIVVRRTVSERTTHIDDALWQNAALALPAKVLCSEACRGLCPHCGANRNRTPCACHEAAPDPRLSALGNWRPEPRR